MADNLGASAPWLTWIRYTAFIPLYPVGLFAELVCMQRIIPIVTASRRLSLTMPNPANIAFEYSMFLRFVLVVQPLAWIGIYRTLLIQRRKRIAACAASPSSRHDPTPSATCSTAAEVDNSRGEVQSDRTGSVANVTGRRPPGGATANRIRGGKSLSSTSSSTAAGSPAAAETETAPES